MTTLTKLELRPGDLVMGELNELNGRLEEVVRKCNSQSVVNLMCAGREG